MSVITLNSGDCDAAFAIAQNRGYRKAGETCWAGCRATHGIALGKGGKWAFRVDVETPGSIRIGWSTVDATLELGMDKKSFGYGGTGTKSHEGKYGRFGQNFSKGDSIVALLDADKHVLQYAKNGNKLPGDCFRISEALYNETLYPHVLVKDSSFSIHFDGRGQACTFPGYAWISDAPPANLCRSPKEPCDTNVSGNVESADCRRDIPIADDVPPWKISLNAYVHHFQELLSHEYVAEKEQVVSRSKRSLHTLQMEGYGCGKLRASLHEGRIIAHPFRGVLPTLSEIHIGREVLLSGDSVDLNDATKTISGEVSYFEDNQIFIDTTYTTLPKPGTDQCYRIDLGPNITTFERMDKMLDSLQRSDGPSKTQMAKNKYKLGLLLPNTALSDALLSDIGETSIGALKWDPCDRQLPNPDADISQVARSKYAKAPPYTVRTKPIPSVTLNQSQQRAVRMVVEERRRLTFIQGPPGTGKTTTAAAIVCDWLRNNCGPVLCTAFSNKGTDHIGLCLHNLGVKVVRIGQSEVPFAMDTLAWESNTSTEAVLNQCDVVCATCVGAGMSLLRGRNFPFVVMDEAAQVIEPACLIPLSKGCVSCVMVGDQCQLPPTVMSDEANRRGLGVSLFDRLIHIGMDVHMLDTQYRMHPTIASFSSWRFYRSALRDGVGPSDRPCPVPWASKCVLFVHVPASENAAGSSKSNKEEAACVGALVQWLREDGVGDIGVITPYSAQVHCIRQNIRGNDIQVSSVDAFQGSEREVIVCSMVRANSSGQLGFVSDWRRLNVALTRSKSLLIVACHIPTMVHKKSTSSSAQVTRDMIAFYGDKAGFYEWDAAKKDLRALPAEIWNTVSAQMELNAELSRLPSRKDNFLECPVKSESPKNTGTRTATTRNEGTRETVTSKSQNKRSNPPTAQARETSRTVSLPKASYSWPWSFADDLQRLGAKFNVTATWTDAGNVEVCGNGDMDAALSELNEIIAFYK